MENPNWRLHFEGKLSSIPSSNQLSLSSCLEQGLINWIEYSLWAKNSYQLPLLSDEFSSANKADTQLWTQHKQDFKWTSSLMPIAKWNEIVYVACLEKPQSLPNNFQAVLASPFLLDVFWQAYNPQASGKSESNFKAHSAPQVSSSNSGDFSLEDAPASKSNTDQIDGLDMDLLKTLVSKAPSDPSDSLLQDLPELENHSEKSDSEELELDLDLGATEVVEKKIDLSSAKPTLAAEHSDMPTGFEESASPTKLFEVSKEQKAEPISSEPVFGNHASDFPLLTAHPNFLKEQSATIQKIKADIKERYNSCAFMLVDSEASQAVMLNEKQEIQAQNSVSLAKASCFQLAVTTQKAYHGPIIKNAIAEKFFEDWNNSEIPDNLTIVPVVVRGIVLGLFVAMGERKTYSNDCLALVEDAVAELLNASGNSSAA